MNDFQVIDWDVLLRFDVSLFRQGTAVSIGGFDGLHLGHLALFEELKRNSMGMLKGVVTFYTPPTYMLSSSSKHGLISTFRLKKEKFKRLGIDFVILVDFSSNFAKMGAENFVGLLKKYLNIKFLIVGSDFRFGYNRSSSIEDMRFFSYKFSFVFEAFQPLLICGQKKKISSSDLRTFIYNGSIVQVNSLLGEPFMIDLLDVFPCEVNGKGFKFKRKDVIQVLPKVGRFEGVVCVKAPLSEEKVVILLDDNYLELIFENSEISKAKPYFDILKFV